MKAKNIQELTVLFLRVKQAMKRSHACAYKPTDRLSAAQMEVLWFVSQEGRPSMRALAAHLGITPPSATGLVDALVKKGELKRYPGASDRRTTELGITPKGTARLEKGIGQITEHLSHILKPLSVKEMEQLAGMLTKICKATERA